MVINNYEWLLSLDSKELDLIKIFLLNSGSLKKVAKKYEVSYPTMRKKLDDIIHKIELSENRNNSNLISYIKDLVINGDITIKQGKEIIHLYEEEDKSNN